MELTNQQSFFLKKISFPKKGNLKRKKKRLKWLIYPHSHTEAVSSVFFFTEHILMLVHDSNNRQRGYSNNWGKITHCGKAQRLWLHNKFYCKILFSKCKSHAFAVWTRYLMQLSYVFFFKSFFCAPCEQNKKVKPFSRSAAFTFLKYGYL